MSTARVADLRCNPADPQPALDADLRDLLSRIEDRYTRLAADERDIALLRRLRALLHPTR